MKILENIRKLFQRENSIYKFSDTDSSNVFEKQGFTSPPIAYVESAVISSCVNYIANLVSGIPFAITKKDGTPVKSDIENLIENPNSSYSFREILFYSVIDYYLWGYSFWIKSMKHRPKEITFPRACETTLLFDDAYNFQGIKVGDTEYDTSLLVKFINYSSITKNFESKIQPALLEFIGDRALLMRISSTDRYGGVYHPVIAPSSGVLPETSLKGLKIELLNQIRSSSEIPIICSTPIEVKSLATDNNRDLDKAREIYRNRILEQVLGVPDLGTYSNAELMEYSIFRNTILPLARFFEDRINKDLVIPYDRGIRFRFLITEAEGYKRLIASISRELMALVDRGILSINEARKLLDLEPIEEGDRRLLSTSVIFMPEEQKPVSLSVNVMRKIVSSLEKSEKLDEYFAGKIPFSELKKYYTTLVDLPGVKSIIAEKHGQAEADKFENRFKQYFLSQIISSTGKNEFIEQIKDWILTNLEE